MLNQPQKHHYLPVFYLRQWAGSDGRLVQFTKPHGNMVKPRRVYPEATGYIHRLYAVEGLPEDAANDFEKTFLSPVDSQAADALRIILDQQRCSALTERQRLAWTAFIGSLLTRMPADLHSFRMFLEREWQKLLPMMRRAFDNLHGTMPLPDFDEILEGLPDHTFRERALGAIKRMVTDQRLALGLAGMEWSVLTLDHAQYDLLTSDRPIVHTNVLNHELSHLILPVGPRHLFIAAKSRAIIDELLKKSQIAIVREANRVTVENATALVIGSDDTQLRFVQNRMGQNRTPTIIERLATAPASPTLEQDVENEISALEQFPPSQRDHA